MSGYVYALSECVGCHNMICYNPHKVPSIRVHGKREPLCRTCATQINENRKKANMPECPIPDDAYEPLPESEL
jgi:Fe-S-cluster-containing dehydrogenase component